MAHIIELATGQVCGPTADEHPGHSADHLTEALGLELQQTASPRPQGLPADLTDVDGDRFIEAMEKF